MKTATNKRYSYSRVVAIRIDVHPAGENPTNMPHTFHAQSAYDHQLYVSHVIHIEQPFVSCHQIWMDPTALKKRAPDTIHSTPTDRFTRLYPVFLPS
jgi:hypothetical protein